MQPPTAGTPSTPAPAPEAKPERPAPTFAGNVTIKIFSELIATGGEQVSKSTQKKLQRVKDRLAKEDGVSSVSVDPINGTISVGYSGPYDRIEDLGRIVSMAGIRNAVVNPAPITFRPASCCFEKDRLIQSLKANRGVAEVVVDGGSVVIYADMAVVDLKGLEEAARAAGVSGRITSHEIIEIRLGGPGDFESLQKKLNETKYVLKSDLNGERLEVTVVRGRVSKGLVKKLAESCGFKT